MNNRSWKVSLIRELVIFFLIFLFLVHFFKEILKNTDHLSTWIFLGLLFLLPIFIIQDLLPLVNFADTQKTKIKAISNNLLLLIISGVATILLLEIGLAQFYHPVKEAGNGIPQNYKKQTAKIPGAANAFYWMGKLHVFNKDLFRRTSEEFPPKKEGVFRIMVIGDSHAYGYGVAAEEAYPSLIEKELKKEYSVEVLNLGVMGAQPHNYVETLQKYLPLLHPDLVLYGITQNDYMPPGKEPYWTDNAYLFPLPEKFKMFLVEQTEVGKFLSDKYNVLLFRLGLRNDYMSDIIRGRYTSYFAPTTKKMNDLVLSQHLSPIIAFMTDQTPDLKGKNWKVTQITEKILQDNGFTVIPAEDYYRKYNGQIFFVSPEEHHPSAEDHQIFADYWIKYLKTLPQLQKYKIAQ